MNYRSFSRSLIFVFVGLLIALPFKPTARANSTDTSSPALEVPTTLFIREELYFGLSLADGRMLSETQWQEFLREEITPRFQEGLTVIDADGQWLNAAGVLVREPTKVVILLYADSRDRDRAIEEIIDRYKQQFNQESVLRVTSPVRVSF
ncbi:MAG: DUF3574 domain-containing protein [Cyanobacteriota bacterium]|nr:DUF3574 domain-containing protein [Cyanobacteriota bacterium]